MLSFDNVEDWNRIVMEFGVVYFAAIEVAQIVQAPMLYLNFFNFFDILSLILNFAVILDDSLGLKKYKGYDHILGAICVFLMWFKVLQFLRLFDSTSYYVRLIKSTL